MRLIETPYIGKKIRTPCDSTATLIYKRTKNLRAAQLLLGHAKLESTVRYHGIEIDDVLTVVHEVKKIGCAEAEGAAGYNCDVEADVSAPIISRTKNVAALRLVEASDGW